MPELRDPEILRTVLESLPLGVYVVDRERRILFWNEGAEKITGYLRQSVVGRLCREDILIHCDDDSGKLSSGLCPLTRALRDGQLGDADMYLRHHEGHRLPVHVRTVPIRDSHGSIVGAAESFEPRSPVPQPDRRIDKLETYRCLDLETGLANRRFMESLIEQQLILLERHAIPFCLLMLQVDNLEGFQHQYGREAVDEIHRAVGQTLKNALRPTDAIGRWDQNRFLAVVLFCPGQFARKVAERLRRIVPRAAISWWGDQLSVTVSIGAASATRDKVDRLAERAAEALESAMKKGGDQVAMAPLVEAAGRD